jgi:hypothetical protein
VELTLVREPTCEGFTRGELFLDGVHECFVIEDQVRKYKEVPGGTAIPPYLGQPPMRYRVVLTKSPRFGKVLPELLNVPDFRGVRIHAGNTADDTEGCLIVGQRQGKSAVFESKPAMLELMAALSAVIENGEQVWIEVRNADPAVS